MQQATVLVERRTRVLRTGQCPCCSRILLLTFHHLIPKKVHRRQRFSNSFDRNALSLGIYICRDCHQHIHRTYDEMQLASNYRTPEALINDPVMRPHFQWLARQRRRSANGLC